MREAEEALALDRDAPALALGTDDRRRARLRAGASALAAGELGLDRDLRLDPAERVLEREADLGLQVGAARRSLTPASAAEDVAEPAEQVGDVAEVEVEPAAAGAPPGKPPGRPSAEPKASNCFRFSGSDRTS